MPSIIRRAANKLVSNAGPYIPLPVYRRLFPRPLLGFFYHTVSDQNLPHVRHLYPFKSRREFEADIAWIRANTKVIGYDEVQKHLLDGASLPPGAAFLSFDDGFVECFRVVRPILLKHRLPAVFFLTTDWIDNRHMSYRGKVSLAIEGLLTMLPGERAARIAQLSQRFGFDANLDGFIYWIKALRQEQEALIDQTCELVGMDVATFLRRQQPFLTHRQIRQMHAEGFAFGAHSRRHAKLVTLPPAEQAAEIVESCRIVAQITGMERVPFAFPFSGNGISRRMLADLRRRHPEIGPLFDTQKLRQEPGITHRIWVDKPVPGIPAKDNLAYWLCDAYRRMASEIALGSGSGPA